MIFCPAWISNTCQFLCCSTWVRRSTLLTMPFCYADSRPHLALRKHFVLSHWMETSDCQFKALIAIFWDLQPLWSSSLTKPNLLTFRCSSGHAISKPKSVTPHFFYNSGIANSRSFNGKIFRKKSMLEKFRTNVLKCSFYTTSAWHYHMRVKCSQVVVSLRADLHGMTLQHTTSLRHAYDMNCFV